MNRSIHRIQLKDLLLLVAFSVIPILIADSDRIPPFTLFTVASLFLAFLASYKIDRWAATLNHRFREDHSASGPPTTKMLQVIALYVLTLAIPVTSLILLDWTRHHWSELTHWLGHLIRRLLSRGVIRS